MLRLLVLLLLLANAGYFAWSQGLLASYGFAPSQQSEPQRLTQQLRPEAMQLLSPREAQQLENTPAPARPAATPAECLQAGPFNEAQSATLRASLQKALPAGSWALEGNVEPARWMVYMGKYTNADALAKKRSELRQLGVSFETVSSEALSPGLSLGSFATQAAAESELAKIATRGVRTAKVIQERAESRGQLLKLASVDAGLKAQLEDLKPQFGGKALQACH